MAIYYMNVQIIGRSAGRSATGAAAYRAGERIHDDRTDRTFDYTRRRGEIDAEILAPAGAPEWVQDRGRLWNEAEKAERRSDAQVAREMVVAFPIELSRDEQRDLIRAYVQEEFVAKGMAADVAIHRNPGNPHAHIMLTMREIGPEGFSAKKNRDWNRPEMLEHWREQWAVQANRALERAGREERIDHRSLAEQGVEWLPQVHLGPHASALERRGVATEKGEQNRLVAEHNTVVVDLAKAREQRKKQQFEKAVMDRHSERLQAGWLPVHAQPLAQLEYDRGGSALTRSDVADLLSRQRQELAAIQQRIQAIHHEGDRLDRAAEVLRERQEASDRVDRLGKPLASARRLFSNDARKELEQAQESLQMLNAATGATGTTSEEQLADQRHQWQQERTQLPALQERSATLSRVVDLAARALEGFIRQYEREQDWLQRPKKRRRPREEERSR